MAELDHLEGRALQDGHGAMALTRLNALVDVRPGFQALGALGRRDVKFILAQQSKALRVQDAALGDLAGGGRGTEAQAVYGRAVAAIFDRWQETSPAARRFLVDWPPFRGFARTAARLVGAVFGADHLAVRELGEATAGMTAQEREALGLPGVPEPRGPRLIRRGS